MLKNQLKILLVVTLCSFLFCNPASAETKILYMNQGGGGNWGAIRYSKYDAILLAESKVLKTGFNMFWTSRSLPKMSIQKNSKSKRKLSDKKNLDPHVQEVRPIESFIIDEGNDNVRVVFLHLKSGNKKFATQALERAIRNLEYSSGFTCDQPVIWIGDFNRADPAPLVHDLHALSLVNSGGESRWYLDRLYISGNWNEFSYKFGETSRAGDNGHVGIWFSYNNK
ncbi:MAG: hypothetical protein AAF572_25130 [Cyanobacteria bacterium P01_B01_bin.77]